MSLRGLRRALFALGAAVALARCGSEPHVARPEAAPALTVAVEAVTAGSSAGGLEATGTVEAARRASPGTILAGRVIQILKVEGARVRRGETLARVESGDVAARVAQAESAVVAASSAELNARRMRERLERLVPKQAASPRSLEDAVAGHEAAQANLHAAQEGVAAARVMLGYGEVTAPFDGIIVRRMIELGDTAAPGMPMFIVEDTARMKVEAALPETSARGMKVGAPVEVTIDGAGAPREATLAEILPAADAATRTVLARVLLENADGALRPGLFARVRFSAQGPEVLSVPEAAIVRRGPLAGVFVVDDGVARLRWITLGAAHGGRMETLSGLSAGERIVSAPPEELTDGRRIASGR